MSRKRKFSDEEETKIKTTKTETKTSLLTEHTKKWVRDCFIERDKKEPRGEVECIPGQSSRIDFPASLEDRLAEQRAGVLNTCMSCTFGQFLNARILRRYKDGSIAMTTWLNSACGSPILCRHAEQELNDYVEQQNKLHPSNEINVEAEQLRDSAYRVLLPFVLTNNSAVSVGMTIDIVSMICDYLKIITW
jgi:hypothetical protein